MAGQFHGLNVSKGFLLPLWDRFSLAIGKNPNKKDDINIGPNNENGITVSNGEIVEEDGDTAKVYSDEPMLNGKSPAYLLYRGADPNIVFAAQERFKKVNRIKDDGSHYKNGGEKDTIPMLVDPEGNLMDVIQPSVVSAPLPKKFKNQREAANYAKGYQFGRKVAKERDKTAPYVAGTLLSSLMIPGLIEGVALSPIATAGSIVGGHAGEKIGYKINGDKGAIVGSILGGLTGGLSGLGAKTVKKLIEKQFIKKGIYPNWLSDSDAFALQKNLFEKEFNKKGKRYLGKDLNKQWDQFRSDIYFRDKDVENLIITGDDVVDGNTVFSDKFVHGDPFATGIKKVSHGIGSGGTAAQYPHFRLGRFVPPKTRITSNVNHFTGTTVTHSPYEHPLFWNKKEPWYETLGKTRENTIKDQFEHPTKKYQIDENLKYRKYTINNERTNKPYRFIVTDKKNLTNLKNQGNIGWTSDAAIDSNGVPMEVIKGFEYNPLLKTFGRVLYQDNLPFRYKFGGTHINKDNMQHNKRTKAVLGTQEPLRTLAEIQAAKEQLGKYYNTFYNNDGTIKKQIPTFGEITGTTLSKADQTMYKKIWGDDFYNRNVDGSGKFVGSENFGNVNTEPITPLNNNIHATLDRPKDTIVPPTLQTTNNNVNGDTGNNWFKDNKADLVGAGINALGSIGGAIINAIGISKQRHIPRRGVMLTPSKLKTKININPQLAQMRETLSQIEQGARNNSASSRNVYDRILRARGRGIQSYNSLLGDKENRETALINQDRLNQQQVRARNVQNFQNIMNTDIAGNEAVNNRKAEAYAENGVALLNNFGKITTDLVAREDARRRTAADLSMMSLAYPDAAKLITEHPELHDQFYNNYYSMLGSNRFYRRRNG